MHYFMYLYQAHVFVLVALFNRAAPTAGYGNSWTPWLHVLLRIVLCPALTLVNIGTTTLATTKARAAAAAASLLPRVSFATCLQAPCGWHTQRREQRGHHVATRSRTQPGRGTHNSHIVLTQRGACACVRAWRARGAAHPAASETYCRRGRCTAAPSSAYQAPDSTACNARHVSRRASL